MARDIVGRNQHRLFGRHEKTRGGHSKGFAPRAATQGEGAPRYSLIHLPLREYGPLVVESIYPGRPSSINTAEHCCRAHDVGLREAKEEKGHIPPRCIGPPNTGVTGRGRRNAIQTDRRGDGSRQENGRKTCRGDEEARRLRRSPQTSTGRRSVSACTPSSARRPGWARRTRPACTPTSRRSHA